ncbi:hypothetical protein VKT23_005851 [Stygiomarasmius scandens]|uniref:Uncharacterized protein n=1 Tax=Marasmiellus scandens TaxID=2682957 RepID=A0ABR1JSX5_9AGAR
MSRVVNIVVTPSYTATLQFPLGTTNSRSDCLTHPTLSLIMPRTQMADDIDTTSQSNSTNSTGPNNGQDSPSVTSVLSSSSSSQKRSKLVAIIIGVVAPLFLIFAGILFLRRRYRSQFSVALARIVPKFGWIRSKASQVFHERREGQARERIWSHDFKLTPLPRRNKRRNSNASRMRSYTPGLDMHCRGDDYPEELGTPRADLISSFLWGVIGRHVESQGLIQLVLTRPL